MFFQAVRLLAWQLVNELDQTHVQQSKNKNVHWHFCHYSIGTKTMQGIGCQICSPTHFEIDQTEAVLTSHGLFDWPYSAQCRNAT